MYSGVNSGYYNGVAIYINGNRLDSARHYTYMGDIGDYLWSTGGREVTLVVSYEDQITLRTYSMGGLYQKIPSRIWNSFAKIRLFR